MNEPIAGRSEIGQPEPVHDYGLTAADRMIAASRLSDAEIMQILKPLDKTRSNMIYLFQDFARAIEAAVLARQSVPDDVAKDAAQDYKRLYEELLYAVAMKYHGETRHQTALKYIRHAEDQSLDAARDATIAAAPLPPKE
jgi:hypothetical protein